MTARKNRQKMAPQREASRAEAELSPEESQVKAELFRKASRAEAELFREASLAEAELLRKEAVLHQAEFREDMPAVIPAPMPAQEGRHPR